MPSVMTGELPREHVEFHLGAPRAEVEVREGSELAGVGAVEAALPVEFTKKTFV